MHKQRDRVLFQCQEESAQHTDMHTASVYSQICVSYNAKGRRAFGGNLILLETELMFKGE